MGILKITQSDSVDFSYRHNRFFKGAVGWIEEKCQRQLLVSRTAKFCLKL